MIRALAFLRDTRGAAAAEMALMIPLLLTLMFVSFEAGHYFYTEHKVIKSVREGARYGGRLPWGNFPCEDMPEDEWFELADDATLLDIQTVTRTGTVTGTMSRVSGMETDHITVRYRCDTDFGGGGIFVGTTGGAPILLVQARTGYNSLFGQLGLTDTTIDVQASAEAVVNGI